MNNCGASVKRRTGGVHSPRAGAVPGAPLHFHTNKIEEANQLVVDFHYSKRPPANVQFVGSLHESGGLFGDQGMMVAAAFFSVPPTRWGEDVLELSRLVRRDNTKPPLSRLISLCIKELKKRGADLLVSFADRTYGHKGTVYLASGWNCHGDRSRNMDGVLVNGTFIPGRTANSLWGTRSPTKLRRMFPEKAIEPHYDEGKRLYWKSLGRRGDEKARRLGLVSA